MLEDARNIGVFRPFLTGKFTGRRLLVLALIASLLIHFGVLLSSMGWRIIGVDNGPKSPDGAVLTATLAPRATPITPTLPAPAPPLTVPPMPTSLAASTPTALAKPLVRPAVSTVNQDDANDVGLQSMPTLGALPEGLAIAPVLIAQPEPPFLEPEKAAASPVKKVEPVVTVAEGESNATPRLDATPGTIDIRYKVTSSVVDAIARYQFSRDKNNKYEIESSIEATGFFATIFEGRMQQTSRGSISEQGLLAEFYSIRRGSGAAETATFDYASNNIVFNRRKGVVIENLPHRVQDMQSFLFQMGFDAPNVSQNPNSDGADLDVVATNARKIYRYKFKFIAKETLDLPFGKVETIHLKSNADDPTDVYEVWLATAYNHIPVKVKFYAGKFPLEQIAQSVTVTPFKP